MSDRTTATKTLPTLAATPIEGETRYVECKTTVLIGGMYTEVTAGVLAHADVELQPRVTSVDGAIVLDLLDSTGNVVASTTQAVPKPAEPEPWPRTQTVPPGVWTDLVDGTGSVLNETSENATVAVDEDGTMTFGAPMRWQSTEVGDDYDGWGEDV